MSVDWTKAKLEYISTNISKTALADKFGVSRRSVVRRASDEKWDEAKEKYVTGVTQKVLSETQNVSVDFATKLYASSEKLIGKVNQLLELEDALSPRDLKSLTSAMLDLKMLRDIKAEDEKEDDSNKVVIEFVNNEWDV